MTDCRWYPTGTSTGTGEVFTCYLHNHTQVVRNTGKVIVVDRPERVDLRPYYLR